LESVKGGEEKMTSTRPECPVCETSSLTGELHKKHNDVILVSCEKCKARVFMTKDWKVIRAEVHYTSSGKIT
jgi:transcription elongation factor Elf1